MVSRAESAAATRRALLDAAGELLDEGGVDVVTLREVGARAGVSRGAPYRHFADKASLLSAVAAEGWQRLGHRIHALRRDPALPDADKLHGALRAIVELGRDRPHLHQMMCNPSSGDLAPIREAAERYRDEFLAIVATLVGEQKAGHYGALLLASAYGTADMERSGHLAADTWNTTADNLIDTLVDMIVISRAR
ncbi:TetR/AcrR family transcriptional regulator [Kineococcus vitellinus]|uniref:TetR/AcrR family transcriptional regulator n=1 Tax=Kineococcus vitellinus TaxID=2696565 RepID=UPI0014122897|nr:TetR/AcrR family transcriptional regulator [Kineococcus vitellinus]